MAFAEDQKRRGDSAYKRKDWFAANSAYTQALKLNPPAEILHLIHSNRSATRLQLNDVSGAEEGDQNGCSKPHVFFLSLKTFCEPKPGKTKFVRHKLTNSVTFKDFIPPEGRIPIVFFDG